jgi:hypothetical protein
MSKQLKIKNVDSKFCLTVREVKGWLTQFPDDQPIILNCGKNFRLAKFENKNGKPVLVGRRSARD